MATLPVITGLMFAPTKMAMKMSIGLRLKTTPPRDANTQDAPGEEQNRTGTGLPESTGAAIGADHCVKPVHGLFLQSSVTSIPVIGAHRCPRS
jgi:hypothetical protein